MSLPLGGSHDLANVAISETDDLIDNSIAMIFSGLVCLWSLAVLLSGRWTTRRHSRLL